MDHDRVTDKVTRRTNTMHQTNPIDVSQQAPLQTTLQAALRSGPVMRVDLSAIQRNFRTLGEMSRGLCAAVVKGDAYGHGMLPASQALLAAGATLFFTARYQDALLLRDALGAAPRIAVLDGIASSDLPEATRHGLIPVVNSLEQLEAVARQARSIGNRVRAFVHLDTAMNRLGISARDDERAADALTALDIHAYMTHFASADDVDIELCRLQVQRLVSRVRQFPEAPLSIANSCGLFLGDEFHGAITRPGKSTFGINPLPEGDNPLEEPATVLAPVVQVRTCEKGEAVGYSGTWRAPGRRRIATLAIGYANGFMRGNSNRGTVAFNGREVPIVGRVSMDLTTVDVTSLPEDTVGVGAVAEIVGPTIHYRQAAETLTTNEHETIIALGRGCHRVYGD